MAEFDSPKIGNSSISLLPDGIPTGTAKATGRYKELMDFSTIHNLGLHRLATDPPSFFVWTHTRITEVALSTTKESLIMDAPWNLTILAADVGCEQAPSDSATLDIEVAGTPVLDAPEDIKTTAGTAVRVAPEDGSEEVTAGQSVNIVVAAGTTAGVQGAQAHLYCQRS